MAGLAAAGAAFGAAALASQHLPAPLAILDLGDLHYDIRSINDSSGLGGSPPHCAPSDNDYVMVTYMVTNRGDRDLSAIAVPRVVLIDQGGQVHTRDETLSRDVEFEDAPLLSFHQGLLRAHEAQTVADVFVTTRNATRYYAWNLRLAPLATRSIRLPPNRAAPAPDCPRISP